VLDHLHPRADARTTRVLVVDEQRFVAELLAAVLQTQPDLECSHRAFSAEEARDAFAAADPDVVVIQASLGQSEGLALAAELLVLRPDTRVVITDGDSDYDSIFAAARTGVCAYLQTGAQLGDVLEAIRTSRVGTLSVPTHLVAAAIPHPRPVDDGSHELTPREREVLGLLGDGVTVDRISRQLTLSVHTTRGYVKSLLAKLDAHSQLEAVAIAKRRGLLRSAS
jgi:DNA-binding NarL/FixJ family response regulator